MTTVIETREFRCEGRYRIGDLEEIDKAAVDRLCAEGMAFR